MKDQELDTLLRGLMNKVCNNVKPSIKNTEHEYELSRTHPMPYSVWSYNYQLSFLVNKTNGLYVTILKYNVNTKEYFEVFKYENDDNHIIEINDLKETCDIIQHCLDAKRQGFYVPRISTTPYPSSL